MIGMSTKLAALSLLRQRLTTSPDPHLSSLGSLITSNAGYANFGALGTAIGDFAPVRLPASSTIGTPGANPYIALWKLVFNVFGGDETAANPGLKPVLDRVRDLLDRLDDVAAAEDLDALQAMSGEVDTLNQIAADLSAILITIKGDGTLANLGIVPDVADLIGSRMMPASVKPNVGGGAGFPPRFWTLRELLSNRRTGRFAQRLWDRAMASGRDDFKAYALGWLSSWSLSAGGASAVASIVGAPARNQWWRSRFVGNYIDLWAYGYAKVGPRPKPYTDWPNLCEQELHNAVGIPGASFDPDQMMKDLRLGNPLGAPLPGEFTTFWLEAYEHVYGDMGDNRPQVDADRLQDAYCMARLVLWFQTSPQSLGCQANAPMPPTTCGGAPAWTNPVVPGDAGGGAGGPPPPEIDKKIKPENVICAILLAILGIVALCFGGWVAGGAAIAGAIALAVSAGTIDWDKFRCSLAWYRVYMFNGLRALHDVMSLGGLVHPYTPELSVDDTAVQLLSDIPTHIRTGDNIVLTRPMRERYPVVPWNGSGFSWFDDASGGQEEPPTWAAIAAAYPSGFLDDPANPLGSRSPFDASPWPFAAGSTSNKPLGFINSTDAMLAWLAAPGGTLPDHSLDGDRGLGFQNFHFVDDGWTNPVNIEPAP
ncbi:hypothetical protein HSX11_06205 [Oxalobacteraceae bacterium]|nr:hypothetical protein [Oxalobacteraceae bacterium]